MENINLCCGYEILDNYDNYDINPVNKKVKYLDCNKLPYPFKNKSKNIIRINQGLEHLNINPLDFINEALRILKNDGSLLVGLPVYSPGVYHIRHDHIKGYFNPILINKNVKERYTNGNFLLTNVAFKKRPLKGIIYRIIDTYRRYRYQEIYFELIKERGGLK